MSNFDIVGVGFAVFDSVTITDSYPAEDSKLKAAGAFSQSGGPCATALVTAARLGLSTAFFGTLGDDFYGRYIAQELARYGVDTTHLQLAPGAHSPHAQIISNRSNASRTIIWYEGDLPETSKNDIPLSVLKSARALHLDNHQMDAAIWAAQRAREHGVLVSLDAGSPYPGVETLLPMVDVLVPSASFVHKYTGCQSLEEGARQLLERYRPRVFAVTGGPAGGLVEQNGELVSYPARPVNAVDTNGAGDVFHGAFLAALLKDMAPTRAARFAAAAAAWACQSPGVRQSLPGYQQVVEFMQ